jgi:hypothetical protein
MASLQTHDEEAIGVNPPEISSGRPGQEEGDAGRIRSFVRRWVDPRLRDSIWALRSRRDGAILEGFLRGIARVPYSTGPNRAHLDATMEWLRAAQDATPDQGVSALYDLRKAWWAPSYLETTGYIIRTFLDYAALTEEDDWRNRALRMADWLLGLQLRSGAFPVGPFWPNWSPDPIVFDTGQILHGLLDSYEATGNTDYLEAAIRAGDWLADIQSDDGAWREFTPLAHANTFAARVAWGLVRLKTIAGLEAHLDAAVTNLRWVMAQQESDGWFRNAGFSPDEAPLTHTIAYTIRGLLESGKILDSQVFVDSARRAADALREHQLKGGFLKGRYGPGWRPTVAWSCLTGNAQMAIIWMRLFELEGDTAWLDAAHEAIGQVKRSQCRSSARAEIAGGIAGSYPIYCAYEPFRLLNWAAKFFADSLLLEDRLRAEATAGSSPGSSGKS